MLFQGMKELKEFCIPFSSLKLGPNFFDFEIDKSFFDIFNYSRYNTEGSSGWVLKFDRFK